MTKLARISRTMAIMFLIEDGIADRLTYDYATQRFKLDGECAEPKMLASEFGMSRSIEISVKDFQDALYYLARKNTPKPELSEDTLSFYISNWLTEISRKKVTIAQVITECLGGRLIDLTRKGLEMRIASVLSDLGFSKHRTNKGSVWVKKN